ncbi:hypothetical protein J7K18_01635 [bacterium]|nr:hypothetical protein [bacterium]
MKKERILTMVLALFLLFGSVAIAQQTTSEANKTTTAERTMQEETKAKRAPETQEMNFRTETITLPATPLPQKKEIKKARFSGMDAGRGRLENGTARIEFTGTMSAAIADGASPIITVTPLGNCNGLHISSIDQKGFTVVENNEGHSSIEFLWIAIAKSPDKLE